MNKIPCIDHLLAHTKNDGFSTQIDPKLLEFDARSVYHALSRSSWQPQKERVQAKYFHKKFSTSSFSIRSCPGKPFLTNFTMTLLIVVERVLFLLSISFVVNQSKRSSPKFSGLHSEKPPVQIYSKRSLSTRRRSHSVLFYLLIAILLSRGQPSPLRLRRSTLNQ